MTDTINIPGYKAGTWTIDASHSEVSFSVRHLLISKVKGKFEKFDATFTTGENPLDSTVTAKAEVASINTNDENRDGHLRTNDFFDAPTHPELTFVSTGIRYEGGDGFNNLEMSSTVGSSSSQLGDLETLLAWSTADPVDSFEMRRNDRIHAQWQGNRNPFIDHPEWADAVW